MKGNMMKTEQKITMTLDEIKSMFCTEKDINELAITGSYGSVVPFNSPYCWFEDAIPSQRRVFRKMAKQMNFLRKVKGQNPIKKGEE